MDAGLYAELAVECAGVCPVARDTEAGGRVASVSRARAGDTVVEEFVRERTPGEPVTDGDDPEGSTPSPDEAVGAATDGGTRAAVTDDGRAPSGDDGRPAGTRPDRGRSSEGRGDDPERIVTYDGSAVHRFERPADLGCPCEIVESYGVPVWATAAEGRLVLTLHPPDRDTLGTVARALQANYHVELRRVIEGNPGARERRDLAVVDRDRLTDRQEAALRTAHERGYFERPRGESGEEVARALGVSPSTFTEHLRRAQRKVLDAVCATGESSRPVAPGDD